MTTTLLLLADTHWPVRAKNLPAEVWAAAEAADVVVHAGDWVGAELVDRLAERSCRLVACWGNNDGPAVRDRLPEVARAEVEGLHLAVTHETGQKAGREPRADAAFPGVDVLVFGHSHIPWDTTTPAGMRLLNPGSPTDRRRQPYRTYMTAVVPTAAVDAGSMEVTLHRL